MPPRGVKGPRLRGWQVRRFIDSGRWPEWFDPLPAKRSLPDIPVELAAGFLSKGDHLWAPRSHAMGMLWDARTLFCSCSFCDHALGSQEPALMSEPALMFPCQGRRLGLSALQNCCLTVLSQQGFSGQFTSFMSKSRPSPWSDSTNRAFGWRDRRKLEPHK